MSSSGFNPELDEGLVSGYKRRYIINGDAGQLLCKDRHRVDQLLQACKPDPVPCLLRQAQDDKAAIIYLSSTLLLRSICLPISIGRAALIR